MFNVNRHRTLAFCLVVMAFAAGRAKAQEAGTAEAPDFSVAGNVAVVSDYRFRGISNSNRKPALQAGVEASHNGSGVYAGIWGSSVANAAYNNTSGLEMDVYAGWRHQINDEVQLDLGVLTYWFPGARIDYTSPTGQGSTVRYNTQELKAAVNYLAFNITAYYSVGRYWAGFFRVGPDGNPDDVRGTNYIEANWNPDLGNGLTMNLHAGMQRVRGLGDADFKDFRVGLTKTFSNQWQLGVAATRNTGSRSIWTFVDSRTGGSKYAAGNALVLSVQRNF